MDAKNKHTIVIGAGPAGLTAGYLLSKQKSQVTVLESDPRYVGGISRTVEYKGFLFDIGGHRFFSKSKKIEDLWSEILPNDLLERPRLSRIYYKGKFFQYPLRALEALWKLGVLESTLCLASYLKWKCFPKKNPRSFQDWVSNQFGHRLFSIFFKSYTEKVWGMSCSEISADWAAQRIKGLSLGEAIRNALFKKSGPVAKTLIDSFRYPRRGPGMMWEACAEKIRSQSGRVELGSTVSKLEFDSSSLEWIVSYKQGGAPCSERASDLVSSAPLRELVEMIEPRADPLILEAARNLKYRDFLIVVLILRSNRPLPDNWIYIHDPQVQVGRIQNFRSWSSEMVPSEDFVSLGFEYFCFEKDGLWSESDIKLTEKAKTEMERIGLAKAKDVVDACVVRQKKAYPVYDQFYQKNVNLIRQYLETHFPNLHLIGRNGMHKYNNQDHAMMTGILTVENILAGRRKFDVWRVNEDAEYLEESSLRKVPEKIEGGIKNAT
jgi:protoporphyrinogen oxidase